MEIKHTNNQLDLKQHSEHSVCAGSSAENLLKQINDKLAELTKLNERLVDTNEALLQLLTTGLKNTKNRLEIQPDAMTLLALPAALRKTALVLYKLEKATADDLAKETSRMRAVESAAANELVRLGFIKKKRVGHEVYFYIEAAKEFE